MPLAKKKKASKSDFVRSLPTTLTAPEVVKKAKAAGINLSTQLVYVVRGRGKGKPKRAAHPGLRTATPRAESLLKAFGAELGLARAIELLQGERERVNALIRG